MAKKGRRRKKRRPSIPKDGPILHIDSVTATRMQMPKYNGFAIGGGVHGDTRYNRRKTKAETQRIIDEGE